MKSMIRSCCRLSVRICKCSSSLHLDGRVFSDLQDVASSHCDCVAIVTEESKVFLQKWEISYGPMRRSVLSKWLLKRNGAGRGEGARATGRAKHER